MHKSILMAAGLLVAATTVAPAQTVYPERPRYHRTSRGEPTCGPFRRDVRCWNFAGLASTGANLFPNTGRPGLQPGSHPLFF